MDQCGQLQAEPNSQERALRLQLNIYIFKSFKSIRLLDVGLGRCQCLYFVFQGGEKPPQSR